MNTRLLPFIMFILGGALILGSCAKPAAEEAPTPVVEEPKPAPEVVVAPPIAEEELPIVEKEVVEEVAVPEELPEEPVTIPLEEYKDIEQEPEEIIHPDSVVYLYMIRPHDYLIKIAYNEYGNPNEWRRIYSWNRERIGDNPNLIYPYHELELYKPEDQIVKWDYDYTIHVVEKDETLWSIAGQKYGDEIAWIVIFWDNEKALNSNAGMLKPGMELRIRTELWPTF
ncbi:MAG: LysM peptidoglycan-binding domain-containing protein [Candidatus Neomarinimicrobiota bacterium]